MSFSFFFFLSLRNKSEKNVLSHRIEKNQQKHHMRHNFSVEILMCIYVAELTDNTFAVNIYCESVTCQNIFHVVH